MLINKLKEDRIAFFKVRYANDKFNYSNIAYNLLGVVIGESTKKVKEPSDTEVISCIKKIVEGSKFVLEKSELEDIQRIAQIEIDVLSNYLPKQLTEEEIRANIQMCINNGHLNIGMIMKFFKDQYSGQYDGALVSKIAKEIL